MKLKTMLISIAIDIRGCILELEKASSVCPLYQQPCKGWTKRAMTGIVEVHLRCVGSDKPWSYHSRTSPKYMIFHFLNSGSPIKRIK